MNLTNLNEVADRKRIKLDVDKLRDKISRENAKIIKLKVGQDTAYWELKEKLSSTERDHEALQRNMVELQMEHESVSAQYQDELRRRPETLNKLVSTREICDVLEENVSRVRASLQRSAADRAALADAYARAGAAVAAAHSDNERRLLAATNEARSARDLVRLTGEHGAQLLECVSRERARAELAAGDAARLRDQRDALAEQAAKRDSLLQEREKTIQELRNEVRRVATESNERNERARSAIAELEREAGAATALRAALAQAETRGESVARESSRLAAQLDVETAAKDAATQRAATLGREIEEAQLHIDKMKEAMNFLVVNGENLAKQLKDKDAKIVSLEKVAVESQQEIQKLTERVANVVKDRERECRDYEERETQRESERRDFEQRFASNQRQLTERADMIEKLMREISEVNEARAKAETTIAELRIQHEHERGNNEKHTTNIESQLAEYTDTIARLKHEIAVEAKARAEADSAIANLTAERERECRDFKEFTTNAQRELAECNDTIAQLKQALTEEKSARASVDASLVKLTNERERERRELEERVATADRELSESVETITLLRRDLALELETRARADAALTANRAELSTAREDAARALGDVRHLKADARRKDDEAAKQMQIVLSIRGEKERMQEKINELQETITNIQEISRSRATAADREPPEHDDNALAAPPAPFRANPQPPNAGRRALTPTPQRKSHDITLYDLFSDTSDSMEAGDKESAHPREVSGRFESLPRGTPFSPEPLRALKRRHAPVRKTRVPLMPTPPPLALAGIKAPQPVTGSQPLAPQPPASQPPASQPARVLESGRKFFKSSRFERNERRKK